MQCYWQRSNLIALIFISVLAQAVLTQPAPAAPLLTAAPKSPTLPAAKAANGWNIYQTSSVLGDQDVFFNNSGLKIVDRANGNVVTASAPAWKITAYNQKTKRMCSYTVKNFPGINSRIRTITGGMTLDTLPLQKTAKTVLHGISAQELQTPKSYVAKQQSAKEHESADPRFVQSAQMLVAEKPAIPAAIATVLCKFYGVPATTSLPLQFKFINTNGDLNTILLTNAMKPAQLTKDDFSAPNGYKSVSDWFKLEDRPVIKNLPSRKIIQTIKKI
jgi:hypothetical protein